MDKREVAIPGVVRKRVVGPVLVLLLVGVTFAASLSWRCPNCGQTFRFDRRHAEHMRAFKERHTAVCRPRPGPQAKPAIRVPEPPRVSGGAGDTVRGTPAPDLSEARFSAAAAELVAMMNKASAKLGLKKGVDSPANGPTGMQCNLFLQALGRELQAKGRPTAGSEWRSGLVANDIADKIARNESGQWKEVPEKDVQELANRGIVVVGVSWDRRPGRHGHIAIAYPVRGEGVTLGTDRREKGDAARPFVRDGNEHRWREPGGGLVDGRRYYPSDWGAVRATRAWQYGRRLRSGAPEGVSFRYGNEKSPAWYKWLPSERRARRSSP